MHFCVFSYNRGEFLRNCIESIEHCAPGCPISIFDDNSDDAATRQALESLGRRHRVVSPPQQSPGQSKHGGLYANMQAALDSFEDREVMCFLQDDMQLVRSLAREEIDSLEDFIARMERPRLVQPAFFKGCNRDHDAPVTRYKSALDGYLVDRLENSAGAWYSDILMARAGHLQAVDWRFQPRESANERQARAALAQMLYLRNPFAAWLPCATAYRGKTRTLALRLAHRLSGSGFFPLRYMSGETARHFVTRDPAVLPFAEDFLAPASGEPARPWVYYPLQGRRGLKLLNNVELALRRLLPT